ncbi:hypothetical protein ACFX15_011530 [Malus domestica]
MESEGVRRGRRSEKKWEERRKDCGGLGAGEGSCPLGSSQIHEMESEGVRRGRRSEKKWEERRKDCGGIGGRQRAALWAA